MAKHIKPEPDHASAFNDRCVGKAGGRRERQMTPWGVITKPRLLEALQDDGASSLLKAASVGTATAKTIASKEKLEGEGKLEEI